MHDTEPTKRASLLPLVSGLVGLLVAYAFVLSVTDQRMMAVIVAAIMGIAAYLLARIVQLRGRVTVAMAVVGFPLLMALAFTAYRHVTPFVERQKSYDNLRAAGIDFWEPWCRRDRRMDPGCGRSNYACMASRSHWAGLYGSDVLHYRWLTRLAEHRLPKSGYIGTATRHNSLG